MKEFEQAVSLHKNGELDKALLIYNKIIESNKDCNAYHNIAVIYIQKGKYWQAEVNAHLAIIYGGVENYFYETYIKSLKYQKNYNYINKWIDKVGLDGKYKVTEKNEDIGTVKSANKDIKLSNLIKKIKILLANKKYNEAVQEIIRSPFNSMIEGKELKAQILIKEKKICSCN